MIDKIPRSAIVNTTVNHYFYLMPAEQYQPTSDDIIKAKEMMGPSELRMTEQRERRAQYMDDLGINGALEFSTNDQISQQDRIIWKNIDRVARIDGVVNGRIVALRRIIDRGPNLPIEAAGERSSNFSGSVEYNGEILILTSEQAKSLFVRYYPAAVHKHLEQTDSIHAAKELRAKGQNIHTISADEEARSKRILGNIL